MKNTSISHLAYLALLIFGAQYPAKAMEGAGEAEKPFRTSRTTEELVNSLFFQEKTKILESLLKRGTLGKITYDENGQADQNDKNKKTFKRFQKILKKILYCSLNEDGEGYEDKNEDGDEDGDEVDFSFLASPSPELMKYTTGILKKIIGDNKIKNEKDYEKHMIVKKENLNLLKKFIENLAKNKGQLIFFTKNMMTHDKEGQIKNTFFSRFIIDMIKKQENLILFYPESERQKMLRFAKKYMPLEDAITILTLLNIPSHYELPYFGSVFFNTLTKDHSPLERAKQYEMLLKKCFSVEECTFQMISLGKSEGNLALALENLINLQAEQKEESGKNICKKCEFEKAAIREVFKFIKGAGRYANFNKIPPEVLEIFTKDPKKILEHFRETDLAKVLIEIIFHSFGRNDRLSRPLKETEQSNIGKAILQILMKAENRDDILYLMMTKKNTPELEIILTSIGKMLKEASQEEITEITDSLQKVFSSFSSERIDACFTRKTDFCPNIDWWKIIQKAMEKDKGESQESFHEKAGAGEAKMMIQGNRNNDEQEPPLQRKQPGLQINHQGTGGMMYQKKRKSLGKAANQPLDEQLLFQDPSQMHPEAEDAQNQVKTGVNQDAQSQVSQEWPLPQEYPQQKIEPQASEILPQQKTGSQTSGNTAIKK